MSTTTSSTSRFGHDDDTDSAGGAGGGGSAAIRGSWPCLIQVGSPLNNKNQIYVNFEYAIRDGIATIFMPYFSIEMSETDPTDTARYVQNNDVPYPGKVYTPMPPAIYPKLTDPAQSALIWSQSIAQYSNPGSNTYKYLYDNSRPICRLTFIRPPASLPQYQTFGSVIISRADGTPFVPWPPERNEPVSSWATFFSFAACTFQIRVDE